MEDGMTRTRGIGWCFSLISLVVLLVAAGNPEQRAEAQRATPTITRQRPTATTAAAAFPSYNTAFPPPSNWTGRVFALSQNYPTQRPAAETHPWESIDFRQKPFDYLRSVLTYALEGNTANTVDFDVERNAVRKWYHAPWLHSGCAGREYIRGLTRERRSPARELHPNQTTPVENWAVGFYNPPGGYTLGSVWRTPTGIPDPTQASFPVGTVAFKLLFTTADVTQVPFLVGTHTWEANIFPTSGAACDNDNLAASPRTNQPVRLIQVDIAVRDDRATETGWVFGTFIYNGFAQGRTKWQRLEPVGIMWGNDPTVKTDLRRTGAFVNPDLSESVINAALASRPVTTTNQAVISHLGLGGRLNGPIDNPMSSCISCHARAAYPFQSMTPRGSAATYTDADFLEYFKNIPPGAGQVSPSDTRTRLDYSLQLAAGLRAYCATNNCRRPGSSPVAAPAVNALPVFSPALPGVNRDVDLVILSEDATAAAIATSMPKVLPTTGNSPDSEPLLIVMFVVCAIIGLAILLLVRMSGTVRRG